MLKNILFMAAVLTLSQTALSMEDFLESLMKNAGSGNSFLYFDKNTAIPMTFLDQSVPSDEVDVDMNLIEFEMLRRGMSYLSGSNDRKVAKNTKLARKYLYQAAKKAKDNDYPAVQLRALILLAQSYSEAERFDKAYRFYKAANKIDEKVRHIKSYFEKDFPGYAAFAIAMLKKQCSSLDEKNVSYWLKISSEKGFSKAVNLLAESDKSDNGDVTVKRCVICKKSASDIKDPLKKCGGCKDDFIRYCSVECQRKDWPTHKKECNKKNDK